jgi:DNA-binding NarL/FixJ family response regulator
LLRSREVVEDPPPVDPQGPDLDLSHARILYVEDNQANLELVRRILERVGGPGLITAVQGELGVSAFDDSATVYRAVEAGACAYLPKVSPAADLCEAIRAVAHGHTVIPPAMQTALATEIRRRQQVTEPVLTPRETEVLALTADGLSAPEIAERHFVGVTTVKSHLQHVYVKLDVSDRAAAVARAHRLGLLR